MALSSKELKLKRLRTIARSVAGQALIEWLEEFVQFHADVRNVRSDLSYDVRRDAVTLIERDIIAPLRGWAKEDAHINMSGADME